MQNYNSMYDASDLPDNTVDISADPAVKAAQRDYDRAVEKVEDLETPMEFHPRTPFHQKTAALIERHNETKAAKEAADKARYKLVEVKSHASFAPYKADQEAEQKKQRDQLEATQQAKRDADLAAIKAEMRGIYMQQPGATAEAFEKAFPGLLEERNRQAVLSGQDPARRSHFAAFHSVY